MKQINGYSIAAQLCECSTPGGSGLHFSLLCKVFGPVYWESLSYIEKMYFKHIAMQYKQTPMGIAEKAGARPTREAFLNVIFGNRIIERNQILSILEEIALEIALKSDEEIETLSAY